MGRGTVAGNLPAQQDSHFDSRHEIYSRSALGNDPNNSKVRIFGFAAYAHKQATQEANNLEDREIPVVYLGSRDGMYWIYIAHSKDILKTKHASFEEKMFKLANGIEKEYVPIKVGRELNNHSVPEEKV